MHIEELLNDQCQTIGHVRQDIVLHCIGKIKTRRVTKEKLFLMLELIQLNNNIITKPTEIQMVCDVHTSICKEDICVQNNANVYIDTYNSLRNGAIIEVAGNPCCDRIDSLSIYPITCKLNRCSHEPDAIQKYLLTYHNYIQVLFHGIVVNGTDTRHIDTFSISKEDQNLYEKLKNRIRNHLRVVIGVGVQTKSSDMVSTVNTTSKSQINDDASSDECTSKHLIDALLISYMKSKCLTILNAAEIQVLTELTSNKSHRASKSTDESDQSWDHFPPFQVALGQYSRMMNCGVITKNKTRSRIRAQRVHYRDLQLLEHIERIHPRVPITQEQDACERIQNDTNILPIATASLILNNNVGVYYDNLPVDGMSSRGNLTRKEYMNTRKLPQIEWIVRELQTLYMKKPFSHVLDVGGGRGDLSLLIALTFPTVNITLIDSNLSSLQQGKDRVAVLSNEQNQLLKRMKFIHDRFTADYDVCATSITEDVNKSCSIPDVDMVVALHACGQLTDLILEYIVIQNSKKSEKLDNKHEETGKTDTSEGGEDALQFLLVPCCYTKCPFDDATDNEAPVGLESVSISDNSNAIPLVRPNIDYLRNRHLLQLAEGNNPKLSNRAMELINSIRFTRFLKKLQFNTLLNRNYCTILPNNTPKLDVSNVDFTIFDSGDKNATTATICKAPCNSSSVSSSNGSSYQCIMKQFPSSYSKRNTVFIGHCC